MRTITIDGTTYTDDDFILEDGIGTLSQKLEKQFGTFEVGDVRVDVSNFDGTFSSLFDDVSSADRNYQVEIFVDDVRQFLGYADIPAILFDQDQKLCSFSVIDRQRRVAREFERFTVWDVFTKMVTTLTRQTNRAIWITSADGNWLEVNQFKAFWINDFLRAILDLAKGTGIGTTIARNDLSRLIGVIFNITQPDPAVPTLVFTPPFSTPILTTMKQLSAQLNVYWRINMDGKLEIIQRSRGDISTLRDPEIMTLEYFYSANSFDSLSITLQEAVVSPIIKVFDSDTNLTVEFTNRRIYDPNGNLLPKEAFANLEITFLMPMNFFSPSITVTREIETVADIRAGIDDFVFKPILNLNKHLLRARKSLRAKFKGLDIDLMDTFTPRRHPSVLPNYDGFYQVQEFEKDTKEKTTTVIADQMS